MNITVTLEDIEHGQRRDPEPCAIARALMRAGLDHFGVMGPSVMVADTWGRLTSLRLPEAVSDWIFNFDAGNPVRPIVFEIALPEDPGRKPTPYRPWKDHSAGNGNGLLPIFSPEPASLSIVAVHQKAFKPSRRCAFPKIPRLGSKRHRRSGLALKLG